MVDFERYVFFNNVTKVESLLFEPSISRNSLFFEPKVVSRLGFALIRYPNFRLFKPNSVPRGDSKNRYTISLYFASDPKCPLEWHAVNKQQTT